MQIWAPVSRPIAKRGSAVAGRRFARRAVRKSRDLIWITTVIQAATLETAGLDIADLVIPADWSLSAGFDRATLMSIRGWLALSQTATGTAAEAPGAYLAIYLAEQLTPANQMDPTNAVDYANFDVIYTDGMAGVGTVSAAGMRGMQIDVRSRRKLTSASEIRLAIAVPVDTATPRFNTTGVLRCLLKLDPS